jgi:hypothetical protein
MLPTRTYPPQSDKQKQHYKISYSCMPNMKTIIRAENNRKLRKLERDTDNDKACNCRNKNVCPLDNKCLSSGIVYQATVRINTTSESYVGLGETGFKTRYRNHCTSFNHERYKNATELSKYIWDLKNSKEDHIIIWRQLCKATPYNSITKRCNLCLAEKYYIIHKPEMCTLNARKDPVLSCRHKNKHLLSAVK